MYFSGLEVVTFIACNFIRFLFFPFCYEINLIPIYILIVLVSISPQMNNCANKIHILPPFYFRLYLAKALS